ncbi:hypothetical protein HUZ88_05010 [Citrobacter portucalensis]|uniref:hypothetical protein n=1 Tax=Citrobacter portucalensis TaxID=1639133 RepID=UPI001EF8A5A2|nr:hypothetical protein [Citrobacter portucalensis]ULK52449.1 hypothetical protein HUZ88_05010 [Citrobacter portucalensis]
MTLEERVEALATTVAQQQATIVQMQTVIADMQGASGTGWRLRANGEVSLGDAGAFGGVVTAAPNQAAELPVNLGVVQDAKINR